MIRAEIKEHKKINVIVDTRGALALIASLTQMLQDSNIDGDEYTKTSSIPLQLDGVMQPGGQITLTLQKNLK